jgi:2-hydroxy-3-oxopropionate reductase
MNLGFIGLGAMGEPMARNLLKADHALAVFARRAEAMDPLVRAGAIPCASAREAAERSDIVFTMVTNTAAVDAVLLGAGGIIEGARAGCVVIDHSTISPAGTRRIAQQLAARSIAMLDAPVSGGVTGAETATLAIMVGGDEAVFARCRHVLQALGRTIIHVGPSGAGQVAKACNQLCIVVNQLAVAEAVLLAEKCGVDPMKVKDALMGGFAASRILDVQGPKMAARDFTGKIESRLHQKDIHIVLDLAKELGIELPAGALAAAVLDRLQEKGGGKLDSAAVFNVIAGRDFDA